MNSVATHQQQIANKLVIGLGKTGLSVAKFLTAQGEDVTVMDTRENPPCLSALQTALPQVEIVTGGLDVSRLLGSSLIVISPGVDPRLPEIVAAREAGVEILGDIELFAQHANAPVIAITGSNGKSTVTTLLAAMMLSAGKSIKVGGNLGTPALELLTEVVPDFYLLELSSFQLETVCSLNAVAAVVLNMTADHLDRYSSEADYQLSKSKIYNGNGIMVINLDDAAVQKLADSKRKQICYGLTVDQLSGFGLVTHNGNRYLAHNADPIVAIEQLKIVGKHNVSNALAALALGTAIGLPMAPMLLALREYVGLPHRCHLVIKHSGVSWFNDSKATNVGACMAAIEGRADNGPIVLIAGGVAKDPDFSPLGRQLKNDIRAIILIGQDAEQIAEVIPKELPSFMAQDMVDAVELAVGISQPGDSVLLSPACASFDMFSSYIARGEAFEKAVLELAA